MFIVLPYVVVSPVAPFRSKPELNEILPKQGLQSTRDKYAIEAGIALSGIGAFDALEQALQGVHVVGALEVLIRVRLA